MDTLVLGIGNLLWADEGFGVRAVSALNEGWRFPDSVTLMDGGTQGLYLLPHIQSARQVLVFDAIDYGLEPGTLQVIRDDDIPSYLGVGKMSLHQSSFQEVLELARFSGKSPERAVLVGVQPKVLKDFGGGLTDIVRAKLPEALAIGRQALADWGIVAVPRAPGEAAPLFDPSLDVAHYEGERPSEDAACRVGDARFLAIRAAREG